MSHRPLTNSSSLKIAAAQRRPLLVRDRVKIQRYWGSSKVAPFFLDIIIYEDDIQYSLQIPLIGNTALVREIAASCTPQFSHQQSPQPRSLHSVPQREKSGFTRFPANESPRRTGLYSSLLVKSSFYLTAFEICRSCHVVPPRSNNKKKVITGLVYKVSLCITLTRWVTEDTIFCVPF